MVSTDPTYVSIDCESITSYWKKCNILKQIRHWGGPKIREAIWYAKWIKEFNSGFISFPGVWCHGSVN